MIYRSNKKQGKLHQIVILDKLNICMFKTPPKCFSIPFISMYLQAEWKTVWILIRWLCQKPAELDLQCLYKMIYPSSAGQELTIFILMGFSIWFEKNNVEMIHCIYHQVNGKNFLFM